MLTKSVLSTLLYHSFFDYPLTAEEIHFWLYKKKATSIQVIDCLAGLIDGKKIIGRDKFFCLAGRKDTLGTRAAKKHISDKRYAYAKKVLKPFSRLSWIRTIAISGNLAMSNSGIGDDIDIFIITAANRLWLSRFLINLLLTLLNKKRSARKSANRFCLNLWLDMKDLKLREKNAFTAHEALALRVIYDKGGFKPFLNTNKWIFDYWPQVRQYEHAGIKLVNSKNSFWDKANEFFYHMQFRYMKSKITSEKIGLHFAYFHPVNRSLSIAASFKSAQDKI